MWLVVRPHLAHLMFQRQGKVPGPGEKVVAAPRQSAFSAACAVLDGIYPRAPVALAALLLDRFWSISWSSSRKVRSAHS